MPTSRAVPTQRARAAQRPELSKLARRDEQMTKLNMVEIRVKNFRCFHEEQAARMAPLTLLVGENGAGKTSFLALIRALWDTAYGNRKPDFKEAPFDLGSFDEIAHNRGGRTGRAATFTAGFDAARKKRNPDQGATGSRERRHRFDASFSCEGTAPAATSSAFDCEDITIATRFTDTGSQEIHVWTTQGEWSWQAPARLDTPFDGQRNVFPYLVLQTALADESRLKPVAGSTELTAAERRRLEQLLRELGALSSGGRPLAGAPARSRPQRNRNQQEAAADSDAETIPMNLHASLLKDEGASRALKDALEGFGREAGLFDEISVRPSRAEAGRPTRIRIRKFGRRVKGPSRDLIDIGYGISQVLPTVAELMVNHAAPMFLLQQPEAHLHPRAQAALGSLFCRIAASDQQLVIETHSDHLLDRVRMDVRDGKAALKPEDVSILFFEQGSDLNVRIHSLRLDGEGNILDAPASYRRFFMEETQRSLKL